MITNDLTIKGRATGNAARQPGELALLGDVRSALAEIFQGNWSADQFYYLNQWIGRNGNLYRALAENLGQDPASCPSQWELLLAAVTPAGTAGASSYTAIAFASAADGTGFTTVFDASLNYIAFKVTSQPLTSPQASDFAGLWKNYKGAKGDPGDLGAAGAAAYLYVAYASAADGTGFTTNFNPALNYIAVKSTTTALVSPQASDFAGLWKQYAGAMTFTVTGALTWDGAQLGLNAASAATANYLVQRDANGSFAANKISLGAAATDQLTFAGSATLGYYNSQFQFSAGILATALQLGAFAFRVVSGALQLGAGDNVAASYDGTALTIYALKLAGQSAGILRCDADGNVSSAATTTDGIAEGSTNLYFTPARLRTTPLTGLNTATGGTLLATDTVLAAFGKVENRLTALESATISSLNPPLQIGANFKIDNSGNVLLRFPDNSWHRLVMLFNQGQYNLDIAQTAN